MTVRRERLVALSTIRDQTCGMTSTDEIVILRIELEGIEPLIWRRVSVRTVMSLTELHHVIQAVMGWLNCHLWAFKADDRRFSMRIPDEPEWNERYEDSETTTLEMLLQAGAVASCVGIWCGALSGISRVPDQAARSMI